MMELRLTNQPRGCRGLTIFFTGLSGAGKSTTANALRTKLIERDDRRVSIFDGDDLRKHFSPDLGFSKEHRDLNIRRIGLLASEITQNGGIAICAVIAPYDQTRKEVRALIERIGGGFLLVHIATHLSVCEQRDHKGLYAKARAGTLPGFTGISDPYEVPFNAELTIDTTDTPPEEAARIVVDHLEREGYVRSSQWPPLAPGLAELINSQGPIT
jgi:sulfate adenylyltransferase